MPLCMQTFQNQQTVYRCRFSCRSMKPGVGCECGRAWPDNSSLAAGLPCLLVAHAPKRAVAEPRLPSTATLGSDGRNEKVGITFKCVWGFGSWTWSISGEWGRKLSRCASQSANDNGNSGGSLRHKMHCRLSTWHKKKYDFWIKILYILYIVILYNNII